MATLSKSRGVMMLEKLSKGLDQQRECHWPGAEDMRIVMVPLSCGEVQEAQAAAEARMLSIGLKTNIFNADVLASELHVQILARSMRDPDDKSTHLFADADELRDRSTPDERTLLADEFIELQAQANPEPDEMDSATFNEIDGLIKKKAEMKLRSYGSRTLVSFLLSSENPP